PKHGLFANPIGDQLNAPAILGIFGGVVEQVGERLSQTGGVSLNTHRMIRQRNRKCVAMSLDHRLAGFDRSSDDLGQVYRRLLQADFATADARNFQQVVNQSGHLMDLPHHHLLGLRHQLRIIAAQRENLDGVADWSEGVAQLMGQRRQELVLAAVGLPQRFGLTAERLLHLLALGDIYTNADQTQRPTPLVEADLPTGPEPVDAAVRPNYSPLRGVSARLEPPPPT